MSKTVQCEPKPPSGLYCKIYIRRLRSTGLVGTANLIYNWPGAFVHVNEFQKFSIAETIRLTPAVVEGEYQGSKVSKWFLNWPTKGEDVQLEISNTDVYLKISPDPYKSEVRVAFFFKNVKEFDDNKYFNWDPYKRKNINWVDEIWDWKATDRHIVNYCQFFFTDNFEIKYSPKKSSWWDIEVLEGH